MDLDLPEYARLSDFGLLRAGIARHKLDEITKRSVFKSWGMASIRLRLALADQWIDRRELGEVIETAIDYPEDWA